MSIIRPYLWLQQPVGPIETDWRHPLARGLVFAAVPSQAGRPDLVGGGGPLTLSGTIQSAGTSGVGANSQSTTAGGIGIPYRTDLFRTITTDFTIATSADIRGLVSNGKLVCAPLQTASWVSPYLSMALARSGTTLSAGLYMGTNAAIFPSGTFQNSTGNKYVATRSGTSASLLHNGTLHAPTSNTLTSAAVSYGAAAQVSLLNRNTGTPSEGTNGTIYYAYFWNRALSGAESRAIQEAPYQFFRPYQRRLYIPVTLPTTSAENFTDAAGPKPVAWWYFNETSGNRVSSGGGNALVPSASAPTRGTGPHDYYSAEFVKANSQQFNLADANMSAGFPGKNGVANGSLTMGGWMRVDSETAGDGGIWSKDTNFQFLVEGPVIFRAFASGNGSLGYSFDDAGTTYGAWKHYVGRWTAETGAVELFVNGVKQSRVDTVATRNTWTTDMLVGNATFKSNFDGGLAELFVFDSALTDAQIADIYNYGLDARRALSQTPQAVTGTAASPKPTVTAVAVQVFPARAVAATVSATKPTVSATSTQTSITRTVAAAATATKPTSSATATQTSIARFVSAAVSATKPAASSTATQTFPARSVAGSVVASKPSATATANSSRRVTAAAASPKPAVAATAAQVFPARSVAAVVSATKPTAASTATQVFPARNVAVEATASKPSASATAVQTFPARAVVGQVVATKPAAASTVVQTFPARSLVATVSAKKPTAAATATQVFPARAIVGNAAAKKPTAAATATQVFPARSVTTLAVSTKPSAEATAFQSQIGAFTLSSSVEATKPEAAATATQVFPARAVTGTAAATKPTAAATVKQTRRITASAAAPKPSASATAVQAQIGSSSVTASAAAKKPTASASAVQIFPARSISGVIAAKKPTVSVIASQPIPGQYAATAAVAPKPSASVTITQSRRVTASAEAPKPAAAVSAEQVFPARSVTATATATKPTVQAFVEQIFPAHGVEALIHVTKPTASAFVHVEPSPGAAIIANAVYLTGAIETDQRIAGSIDMDILIAGTIETDIAITGVIEQQ